MFILYPRYLYKYILRFGVWMVCLGGPVIPNLRRCSPGCLGIQSYILGDHFDIRFIRNPNPYHPCMIYLPTFS